MIQPEKQQTFHTPTLLHEISRQFIGSNIFLTGIQWSPKGNHIITTSSDKTIRIFTIPYTTTDALSKGDVPQPMSLGIEYEHSVMIQPEPIYQIICYQTPHHLRNDSSFSDDDPENSLDFCIFSTIKSQPIQCWNHSTATPNASYCPMNYNGEFTQVYSMSIHQDTLISGSRRLLHIFDLQRSSQQKSIYRITTRQGDGPKGIISAISHCPSYCDTHRYAIGSYSGASALIDLRSKCHNTLLEIDEPVGGVSQIQWSRYQKHLILVGYRQYNYIHCWDERFTKEPLFWFPRIAITGQRLQFDTKVFYDREILFSGDSHGMTVSYDMRTGVPIIGWPLHFSSQTGLSLHPRYSDIIATCSGTRSFPGFDGLLQTTPTSKQTKEHTLSKQHIESFNEQLAYPKTCIRLWKCPIQELCNT